MSAALGLFRLQQVDTRINQIEVRLRAIREVLENDDALRALLTRSNAAEAEAAARERAQREAEQEAQKQKIKIQQAESSLYGGAVHNPKELQDLQNDVQSLRKQLAVLEDRQLEAMLQTEQAQGALTGIQAEIQALKDARGHQHADLLAEGASLERDLNQFSSEREATVSAVAADMLSAYEGLRRERRGLAVAQINDNACGACGTILTAAVQQNARSAGQIVNCPSCGRILYGV
jgi:uncharacterized protein